MISAETLQQLIKHGESNFVECKIAPPRYAELAERICGMANNLGGYIVIGVANETWEIVGLKDVSAALDNIISACRHCKPPVRLEADQPQHLVFDDGKSVVVAYIPPNKGILYQANGIFWIRRGTQTVPLEADEIEKFFHRRGSLSWESRPVRHATLADLDQDIIERFIRNRPTRRGETVKPFDLARFLEQLGCAAPLGEVSNHSQPPLYPTNAGLLLFAYSPQDFLLHAEVICVLLGDRFGTKRYLDRQIFHGNIAQQIDQTENWLRKNIRVEAYTEGFRRVDNMEYPLEALREAVVNALIHRDYSLTGEAVRIFVYENRIEIRSPGLLLPSIRLEDLKAGHVSSHPRNPVIANILRDFPEGYLERVGSGISFILDQMRINHKPKPEFIEQNEFTVIFHKQPFPQETSNSTDVGEAEIQPPSQALSTDNVTLETVEQRYKLILEYVENNGAITNREYRNIANVSERTATRDLETLTTQGTLRASGNRRSRKYVK